MNSDGALKSGRFGTWVYYVRNGKQCRRRYVKPRDPRTAKQLRVRAAMAAASKAYSWGLTEEQRQECRAAGAKLQTRPRLYQSGPLTGQHYFVRGKCAKPRVKRAAAGRRQKTK